ncbi:MULTISPECIES: hypothetical protein [unclassified Gordonia (in: high G+C Gram-positive bacteria)]|jgi:hypothetical protein|uniref:hypothetical protein n=1 Tax=unclassified Gordonia (in: high G+C Gram-positive bacteria) TaxID=2657482 RepID=UPI001962D6E9|nr:MULTISPECIES: hypothetical protein [unclassified Gordonia (in: high G+C Gram-positive bacteria)]MBN0971278.1 hypothetical protein [Gordonia sp. BP-119]MBN0983661.1 hypothetical protein [Gordonia sp. BP-94]WGJ87179.1 hypothetical protein QAD21_08750 [Gordonia sp. SMJS1]
MKLSSKVWSAVGVLLIALALAIWFVVVPSATKFPCGGDLRPTRRSMTSNR